MSEVPFVDFFTNFNDIDFDRVKNFKYYFVKKNYCHVVSEYLKYLKKMDRVS